MLSFYLVLLEVTSLTEWDPSAKATEPLNLRKEGKHVSTTPSMVTAQALPGAILQSI